MGELLTVGNNCSCSWVWIGFYTHAMHHSSHSV